VFVNENTTVKSPICVRRTAVVYFEEFFVFIMNPGATMTEIFSYKHNFFNVLKMKGTIKTSKTYFVLTISDGAFGWEKRIKMEKLPFLNKIHQIYKYA
jgi:hypothetical protein